MSFGAGKLLLPISPLDRSVPERGRSPPISPLSPLSTGEALDETIEARCPIDLMAVRNQAVWEQKLDTLSLQEAALQEHQGKFMREQMVSFVRVLGEFRSEVGTVQAACRDTEKYAKTTTAQLVDAHSLLAKAQADIDYRLRIVEGCRAEYADRCAANEKQIGDLASRCVSLEVSDELRGKALAGFKNQHLATSGDVEDLKLKVSKCAALPGQFDALEKAIMSALEQHAAELQRIGDTTSIRELTDQCASLVDESRTESEMWRRELKDVRSVITGITERQEQGMRQLDQISAGTKKDNVSTRVCSMEQALNRFEARYDEGIKLLRDGQYKQEQALVAAKVGQSREGDVSQRIARLEELTQCLPMCNAEQVDVIRARQAELEADLRGCRGKQAELADVLQRNRQDGDDLRAKHMQLESNMHECSAEVQALGSGATTLVPAPAFDIDALADAMNRQSRQVEETVTQVLAVEARMGLLEVRVDNLEGSQASEQLAATREGERLRALRDFTAHQIKLVTDRGNVRFDEHTHRVTFVVALGMQKRHFGSDYVDEPVAEWEDVHAAQAPLADVAAVFDALAAAARELAQGTVSGVQAVSASVVRVRAKGSRDARDLVRKASVRSLQHSPGPGHPRGGPEPSGPRGSVANVGGAEAWDRALEHNRAQLIIDALAAVGLPMAALSLRLEQGAANDCYVAFRLGDAAAVLG